MRYIRLLLLLFSALLLTSCWRGYTTYVPEPPRTPEERRYHEIWQSTVGVLKKYGYQPEFQDKREGILTTYGVTSGHLLEEIWSKDHSTIKDVGENSLHTIYRAVRVRFIRSGDNNFDITVEVAKARSNMPEAHVTDSSEVLSLSNRTMRAPPSMTFNDLAEPPVIKKGTPLPENYRHYRNKLDREEYQVLVPLGRDSSLEQWLAREIRAAAGLPQSGLVYRDPDKPSSPPSPKD